MPRRSTTSRITTDYTGAPHFKETQGQSMTATEKTRRHGCPTTTAMVVRKLARRPHDRYPMSFTQSSWHVATCRSCNKDCKRNVDATTVTHALVTMHPIRHLVACRKMSLLLATALHRLADPPVSTTLSSPVAGAHVSCLRWAW
jgi:hypothetical protein